MLEDKKSDGNAEGQKLFSAPSISLPKGGGAIRGIGEKFAANPVAGTGSMTVPIAASPGRSGFSPRLSLSYDSGAGNGPFGFGWYLSLPSITRKTDKGLPKYQDADESDTFILSGAEDLVPVLKKQGNDWVPEEIPDRTIGTDTYRIKRFRPRIEGLFARIERWINTGTNETHWRSISRDNIITVYGRRTDSRIEDPGAPDGFPRVFSWLICESYDDKGNAIYYEYEPENSAGIDRSQANERNRTDKSRSANRYLKRIKYGNKTPVEPDSNLPREFRENLSERTDWLFEVVFDYEEGHYQELPPDHEGRRFVNAHINPSRDWQRRQDPFSSYRPGFEVRTYRLCHRVLMFHHFPDELGVDDYLVRATEFTYKEGPIASFITSVTQSGIKRRDNGTYLKKSLPPLEFQYSEAVIREKVEDVDEESLENLPQGPDGAQYQWADIDGEGLSGILTEQGHAWFYKRNISALPVIGEDGKPHAAARFAPTERLATIPSFNNLSRGRQQLLDLAGDGQLDVVELAGPTPGFYERTKEEAWHTFRPFESLPNISWQDPNLKFVDLTGDGHADIFITGDEVFTWYPSLAEAGFASGERVRQALDEEKGPRLVFADGTQSIYLADISGDGLTDLVRIRSDEICFWPNLGYGRFGAKVTMDNSPHFDAPGHFDRRRIRLADIDGSGVTDIIYLNDDGVYIYLNESGNRWADPEKLKSFPKIDDLSSVMAVDLLGSGTACLVWASPLPGHTRRPMRYIDLMGGQKPHLLVKTVNNLGAETHVHYAPSTKFYLADKEAGKPWITRIPFAVHVVERVETFDRVSRNRFISRYTYHHGFFDGIEREFRGFGMVEQIDTEEFAALNQGDAFPTGVNFDEIANVPPVLTRTWFHTGAYLGGSRISRLLQNEYFREPGLSYDEFQRQLLPDTVIPAGLTTEEEREAARSLKGAMLRREVYALDGTEQEPDPYIVTEQDFTIRTLQRRGSNRHAVFLTHAREKINYHYERNPVDPRIAHAMTLEVDDFGSVLKEAAIGYGRRETIRVVDDEGGVTELPNPALEGLDPGDRNRQRQILMTCTENGFTNAVEDDDAYRTPMPGEVRAYEVTGLVLPEDQERFGFSQLQESVESAAEIPYHAAPTPGARQKRLLEQTRTLYRRDDMSGPLPPGQMQSLALPFESYQLAFTPQHLELVFDNLVTGSMLSDEGRCVHFDGDDNWWIPSGRVFMSPNEDDDSARELAFAQQHFFMPLRFRDPFGQTAIVEYDAHHLLMVRTTDPLENSVNARYDYRLLAPGLVTDPNGNRSAAAFDVLGMVTGTAVMGGEFETGGDSLEDFQAQLIQAQIDAFFADPRGPTATQLLGSATSRIIYDETRFQRQEQPLFAASIVRETHVSDLGDGEETAVQVSLAYWDGFGRTIQNKIQAEPGPVEAGGDIVSPRWTVSGWTIFNNKGNPVKQYEPFFSAGHAFEFGVTVGVSPTLFYDPVGRVAATLHPNHTWEKVIFDPWRQESRDVNDTVLAADPAGDPDVGGYFERLDEARYLPTWHQARIDGGLGNAEQDAAQKAAAHADTPAIVHFDSLGRPFLSIADNGPEGQYQTRTQQDIEGNPLRIIDARGNVVMAYQVEINGSPPVPGYDAAGRQLYEISIDAGERRVLPDIAGKPVRSWDSRGHSFRTTYDELQRPTHLFAAPEEGAEVLLERTVYGEDHAEAENRNLRGQAYQVYDGAGVATNRHFDFKGNLLESSRQLARQYHTTVDWSVLADLTDTDEIEAAAAPLLEEIEEEAEIFTTQTEYDALNRPVTITTPDNSVTLPTYNEANLLEQMAVRLQGADQAVLFVDNLDYNARGQRERISYATTDGTNLTTTYDYDGDTFRLTRLHTVRHRDNRDLQDLNYVYDPVGNITSIRDNAQQTVFFNNVQVEPHNNYTYDALYRLIQAEGREHAARNNSQPEAARFEPVIGIPFPNNPEALQGYVEEFTYDGLGNILSMRHIGGVVERWTRRCQYDEDSNRLLATSLPGDGADEFSAPYSYDAHGNMTTMPHLPSMQWDFKDQLQAASRQVVNNGTPETTYYVYNSSGQRVRKVTERQAGEGQTPTRRNERLYLGGFEVYREYNGDGSTLMLERETLHVMDDQQRIAQVDTRTQGNDDSPPQSRRFQLSNHLNSAVLETDQQANVITYEEFHPFGTTSYQAGRTLAEVNLKRYRFSGKEKDEESGLNYHGERYYASWIGRWVRVDPLAREYFWQSPYIYVSSNPLNRIDPTGRGDFYSQEGNYLGTDRKKDNNVYVTTQESVDEFTEEEKINWDKVAKAKNTIDITGKYDITHQELLDMANWVYGESAGGKEIVDYYAHAINNIMKKYKEDPKKYSLYKRHVNKGFFTTDAPYRLYRRFAENRENLNRINEEKKIKIRYSIAAVIGAVTGLTDNPVGNSTLWKGGKTALYYYNKNSNFQKGYLEKNPSPDPINIDTGIFEETSSEWQILERLFPPVPNHPHFKDFVYKETGTKKIHRHVFYSLTDEGKKHYFP